MDNEKLKIKAELAAEIFNTLTVVEGGNADDVANKVVRLTNNIMKGIEE